MLIIFRSLTKFRYVVNSVCHPRILCDLSQKAHYAEEATESNPSANENSSDNERLQRIRNISRLTECNYRRLHGIAPYTEAYDHHHHFLIWKRKQVGLYGLNCGIDPAICFTTKEEMDDLKEYEKVAFNKSFAEIRENALREQAQEKEERRLREKHVAENLLKCEAWKAEILARKEKKEVEMVEAKQKRERLLEEVRRHFGYTIDIRDEKFQIMLEFKEQEQKKQSKLAKKQRKEEILMKKLASLESSSSEVDQRLSEKEDTS